MPDAWNDDWIQKADSPSIAAGPAPTNTKLSKAERRAKQAEFNKQLWEDAERPEDNFFLKTQGVVPLKTEFKPAMKVLSRKPAPKSADPARIGQLSLDDDDEDEEDDSGKSILTPEERIAKAQSEREEKQKAYEERRRELFGEGEGSLAISTTPKKDSNSRNHSRATRGNESRPSSSASNKTRHLYDPNESAKPESLRVQKREPVPGEIQPIREPKAPDGSGRGGFGFAPRGGGNS